MGYYIVCYADDLAVAHDYCISFAKVMQDVCDLIKSTGLSVN